MAGSRGRGRGGMGGGGRKGVQQRGSRGGFKHPEPRRVPFFSPNYKPPKPRGLCSAGGKKAP